MGAAVEAGETIGRLHDFSDHGAAPLQIRADRSGHVIMMHLSARPIKGQTLYVISGVGRVQTKGEPVREIKPGDVVWIPPGEKHWHGGSPTTGMTHVAIQESLDGSHATWMELVTDEEFSAKVVVT